MWVVWWCREACCNAHMPVVRRQEYMAQLEPQIEAAWKVGPQTTSPTYMGHTDGEPRGPVSIGT